MCYTVFTKTKKGNKKMEQKKILKILGAIFAYRANYYHFRGNHDAAVAYDNAFDMLAYAAEGNWNCLSQFGWSDDAEDIVNKLGEDIDFWDLEEKIKNPSDDTEIVEEWACTPDAVTKVCEV